jgi:hypothetical protein
MVTEGCFVLITYCAVLSGREIQSVLYVSPFTGIISAYWFRVTAKSTAHLQNFLVLTSFEVLTALNLRV